MVPVTHPNNLIAGEKATFRLLLDGQPAAGQSIEIVPGGIRYRDKLNDMKATTDESGTFSVTWPSPGMYWMNSSIQDNKSKIENATRRAGYTTTIEVLAPRDRVQLLSQSPDRVAIPLTLSMPMMRQTQGARSIKLLV